MFFLVHICSVVNVLLLSGENLDFTKIGNKINSLLKGNG